MGMFYLFFIVDLPLPARTRLSCKEQCKATGFTARSFRLHHSHDMEGDKYSIPRHL